MDSMKRCIDVAVSLFLLLILSPMLVAAALAIRIESQGTILFRQERVGWNFKRFQILKFRTMRSARGGPRITAKGDDRVTRVGRLLRATKIDELPQLWNVLRGDMSLVGPRPEVPEYVELFRHRYRFILNVRPGITDPAAIAFRGEEEILAASADPLREYEEHILPAKLDLSEKYLQERSLRGDLLVLAKTAIAIFVRKHPSDQPGTKAA